MLGRVTYVHLTIVMLLTMSGLSSPAVFVEHAVELSTVVPRRMSQSLTVECSFYPYLTSMKHFESLSLFRSKPANSGTGSFYETLGSIGFDTKPQMYRALENEDGFVTGSFGQSRYSTELAVSWKSPSHGYDWQYWCTAKGLNERGETIYISDVGDMIYLPFWNEVAEAFRGSRYVWSKNADVFNISEADSTCEEIGGYLVEINDWDEYNFVNNWVKKVDPTYKFYIGNNDLRSEDNFVYYHSGMRALFDAWDELEPNDAGNGEDCVQLSASRWGMNDVPCNLVGRYICEIPE